MSERRRTMYYIEGSTAKVMTVPERRPSREPGRNTDRTPQRTSQRVQPAKSKKVSSQAQRALAFNLGYTIYVVAAVLIMVCACFVMLGMESRINTQQQNISNLSAELEALRDDNAAYRVQLENMYSLDDVYDIATNELGMVYAKKGQIVYYDSANEDYVKQYQDVPDAN